MASATSPPSLSLPQAYYESDIGITEFGFVINLTMVLTISLHLAIETLHWVGHCLTEDWLCPTPHCPLSGS